MSMIIGMIRIARRRDTIGVDKTFNHDLKNIECLNFYVGRGGPRYRSWGAQTRGEKENQGGRKTMETRNYD